MTKADLVEQVADAIGPRVTKRDCRLVVDAFLDTVKGRAGARRPHRTPGLRHLQGAAPHGPQPQNWRTGAGSTARCAGLPTFEALPRQGGPRLWRVRCGRALGGRSQPIVWRSGPRCGPAFPRCRGGVAAAEHGWLGAPYGVQASSQHTPHTHTDLHLPVFFELTGLCGSIPSE